MLVTKRDGSKEALDVNKIHKACAWACEGLDVSQSDLEASARIQFYNGINTSDIQSSLITSAFDKFSETEYDWTFVAARLMLQKIFKEVTGGGTEYTPIQNYLAELANQDIIDPAMLTRFDLDKIDAAIRSERDHKFQYMGMKTLYDRYFLRNKHGKVRELPQHFWMRVAMGIALAEDHGLETDKAIEFYNVLSNLEFVNSTPTLFNSGTTRPQLSSCFVATMEDSLEGIFDTTREAATYSKWSGGLGVDYTYCRATGGYIKGTGGTSGGVVPYMKLMNDTMLGFNQGGKRNGSAAVYLEIWHPDFQKFLNIKNNTGDDRQRAHDLFPASWIPDLFMKRKEEGGVWSFFCPSTHGYLHDLFGEDFEREYIAAEKRGEAVDTIPAIELWQTLCMKAFETGGYWPCFKDEINRRHNQQGSGVVHSSNLCTEITLRNDFETTAVCNLGSINLSVIDNNKQLEKVVRTAIRMLDNVIEVGIIPHDNGKKFNYEERAIGLGFMGYTEYMIKNHIDFESVEHLQVANDLVEFISYVAIDESANLAHELGAYPLFSESLWAKGVLPIDTANKAVEDLLPDPSPKLDWNSLREKVKRGMRNSHIMAQAPTATISLITGTTSAAELPLEDEYNKTTLSGDFVNVHPALRYGTPELCKTMLGVNQMWVVYAAAVRQRWIDQSQSTNLFITPEVRGRDISNWYTEGWRLGMKTFYYLKNQSKSMKKDVAKEEEPVVMCSISNPDCESCQ